MSLTTSCLPHDWELGYQRGYRDRRGVKRGDVSVECASSIVKLGEYEVILWLHTEKNPARDEWEPWFEQMRVATKPHEDLSHFRHMAITDGGAPGSRERGIYYNEIFRGKRSKTAAVPIAFTNSLLRGVGTALMWLNPSFKVFGPEQIRDALTYLDLQGHERAIITEMDKLQTNLPPNKAWGLARGILSGAKGAA